jgi:hypothetical protein
MVDNNDHNTHSPGVESELLISPGTKQVLKGRRATKRVNASNDATARIPRDGTTREIASTKSRPVGDVAAFMKYGSLVLLVAQMVGLVLLMRYTRTKGAKHKSDGTVDLYLASTAVFLMEVGNRPWKEARSDANKNSSLFSGTTNQDVYLLVTSLLFYR